MAFGPPATRSLLRTLSLGTAAWAAVASSCAGPDESPTWSLTKGYYDPYGNAALLSPANDSRVNLLLLLADRRNAALLPGKLADRTFFSWYDLSEAIDPVSGDEAAESTSADPSRCNSAPAGAQAFVAAVRASRGLKPAEREALAAARTKLRIDCAGKSDAGLGLAEQPAVSSAAGLGFLRYLEGAQDFYDGDFNAAATAFATAQNAPDRWVAEAARYMLARNALNQAQATAFDEYGTLVPAEQRDKATLARARQAFEDYLRTFPTGTYAESAQGLQRRVAWLAGDEARLGAAYSAAAVAPLDAQSALNLAEEIDYKLPSAEDAAAGPLLLAVSDLQRMRTAVMYDYEDKPTAMPAGELAAQARAFNGSPALYDYLRAAYAFYVAKTPAVVIGLIPDAAKAPRKSALDFSRQMLRGLALDMAEDRNARGFWLELLGASSEPGQRHAVELALARHDEVTGGLARVFAPDSPVRDPLARAILLQRSAPPALLRQQATRGPAHERGVALSVLLAKELTRGFYGDWLRDVALVSRDASADAYFIEADGLVDADDFTASKTPAGIFIRGELGDFGCPALRQTVATLERNPLQSTARLCLGEFMRVNGFDDFPFDQPLEQGLGSSKSLFPGAPITREAIYRGVIADRAARPDDTAYALFRIVNCYAPSGSNACGSEQAPQSERKGWFQRLKREFPQSRWAKELKYYW